MPTGECNTMKRPNESFLEYKSRVMDTVSPSFCTAKWYNATIWLGHGQTTSCHHPPAHSIDESELERNPSAIHNTPHKKLMRKYMQEGIRPDECEYCWKMEDIGKNNVSDRIFKTMRYTDEENKKASTMDWQEDVTLKTLEISFERTCNFACSYCNPAFSTTWVNDIKKLGPYRNILSDGRGHFTDVAPWAKGYSDEDENPYIRAFWRWWESELSDTLEEIRITGGEPLMAPSIWKLFDWYKENPTRGRKMTFAMNTNLVPKKKETLDKLIEASHHVPVFDVYTSNEAYGKQAEYIRDGMKYEEWKTNLHRLLTEGKVNRLTMMMTINGLCLDSITEFMDDMFVFKRRYGRNAMNLSLNVLRFPSFQSAAILPKDIKETYRIKLKTWLDQVLQKNERDKDGRLLLQSDEQAQIERLIDYLDSVDTPHKRTPEKDKLYNDFKNFYLQYDVRRNKNFIEAFPGILADFMNSIEVSVPTADEILNNKYRKELNVIQPMDGNPATKEVY
jgi:organic radical activating enzyme